MSTIFLAGTAKTDKFGNIQESSGVSNLKHINYGG